MSAITVGQGQLSPAEVLALDPGARLKFFKSVQEPSHVVAALIIRTVLNADEVRPELAQLYYGQVKHLVLGADPVQTYLLAARFIDTPHNSGKALENHQFFGGVLNNMIFAVAGYKRAYVQNMDGQMTSGTFARRIIQDPKTVADCPLRDHDCVLYRPDDVVWRDKRYARGTVAFIRVELDAEWP